MKLRQMNWGRYRNQDRCKLSSNHGFQRHLSAFSFSHFLWEAKGEDLSKSSVLPLYNYYFNRSVVLC